MPTSTSLLVTLLQDNSGKTIHAPDYLPPSNLTYTFIKQSLTVPTINVVTHNLYVNMLAQIPTIHIAAEGMATNHRPE